MMERLSLYLADRMYQNRIINSDDKRFYSYSIQLLLERTIGIFLICFFAALLKNLLEVSLFLVIFALIRRYSDGVHCKTSIGCFVSSVLMSLSTIPICFCILLHPCICQGGGYNINDNCILHWYYSESRFRTYGGRIRSP